MPTTERLFADTALAARIEQAECEMLRDCLAAMASRGTATTLRDVAGGVAVLAGPGSPFNKVAGLGFAGAPTAAELDAIERDFAAAGAPVQIELSCLADAGVRSIVSDRGYRLIGFENVLGLRISPDALAALPARAAGVEVSTSGSDELAAWIDVVATGFANPDTQGVASHESFAREKLERVMTDLGSAPSMTRYLARRDGAPAGGASMRARDGIAQLCGAATLPEHRRHGVQSAMLLHRLEDARRAACDVAVVTTLPGSKSQQNVQRLGFDLLYTRAILVRE